VANDASHHAPLVHDAEPPRVGNRVEQRAGDPTFGTPLPPGPPETAPVAMEAKGFLGPELAQALFLEGNLKGRPTSLSRCPIWTSCYLRPHLPAIFWQPRWVYKYLPRLVPGI
jgi:hypothetical protein